MYASITAHMVKIPLLCHSIFFFLTKLNRASPSSVNKNFLKRADLRWSFDDFMRQQKLFVRNFTVTNQLTIHVCLMPAIHVAVEFSFFSGTLCRYFLSYLLAF